MRRMMFVLPFALALALVVLGSACIEIARDLRAALGRGRG